MIIIEGEPNVLELIPISTKMHAASHMSVLTSYETHEACGFYDNTLFIFLERLVRYKIRPKASEERPEFYLQNWFRINFKRLRITRKPKCPQK